MKLNKIKGQSKNNFRFVLLACILLIAGCGFHLRGYFPIPDEFKLLRIMPNQSFDPFLLALRKTLINNGVKILKRDNTADVKVATLTIVNQNISERNVAYGTDVQANRAVMQLIVAYQLSDSSQKTVIENASVQVTREFQINPNAVLGTENERNHIRSELYLDAAAQLVRQLSVALSPSSAFD